MDRPLIIYAYGNITAIQSSGGMEWSIFKYDKMSLTDFRPPSSGQFMGRQGPNKRVWTDRHKWINGRYQVHYLTQLATDKNKG